MSSDVTVKSISEDANNLIGTARLILDANKSFLIVEGPSDEGIYLNLIDRKRCAIHIAENKPKAKKSLEVLEQAKLTGVLAIVDADFERLDGINFTTPNLLLTDAHDLETMLLQSEALVRVLSKLKFRSTVERSVDELAEDVRKMLLDNGKAIGYLRWVGATSTPRLAFTGLTWADWVDFLEGTLVIRELVLFEKVKGDPRNASLNEDDLKQRINKLQEKDADLWQVCQGHDLTELLTIWCNKHSSTAAQQSSKKLEEYLRDLYNYNDFLQTNLYKAIRVWEDQNKPFRVLPSV